MVYTPCFRQAELLVNQLFSLSSTHSAVWLPDGSQVATGLFINHVLIWNYQAGEQIARLVYGNDESMFINYVEWSPDGSKFAYASDNSTAKVWDAHTWERLSTLQHESPTFLGVAAWSLDGKHLLTGAGNEEQGAKGNTARMWDGETGEELLVFSGHTKSV